jgi:hypothetical protein
MKEDQVIIFPVHFNQRLLGRNGLPGRREFLKYREQFFSGLIHR